MNYLMS